MFPICITDCSIMNPTWSTTPLEKEGGKKRREALRLLVELNVRIRKLKAENKLESEEGQRLVDENLKIKEQLDWRIDR